MSEQIQPKKTKLEIWQRIVLVAAGMGLMLFAGDAAAAMSGQTLGDVAGNVTTSFSGVAKLITATAYVAGMGFALSAILKFKQHKDNPTQVPIGTPIALLFIGAGLIFLPTIFGIAGSTVFGGSASAGGISGTTG